MIACVLAGSPHLNFSMQFADSCADLLHSCFSRTHVGLALKRHDSIGACVGYGLVISAGLGLLSSAAEPFWGCVICCNFQVSCMHRWDMHSSLGSWMNASSDAGVHQAQAQLSGLPALFQLPLSTDTTAGAAAPSLFPRATRRAF
jgi:hypothetical protein